VVQLRDAAPPVEQRRDVAKRVFARRTLCFVEGSRRDRASLTRRAPTFAHGVRALG